MKHKVVGPMGDQIFTHNGSAVFVCSKTLALDTERSVLESEL